MLSENSCDTIFDWLTEGEKLCGHFIWGTVLQLTHDEPVNMLAEFLLKG